jgi:hypothetical protein
MSAKIKREAESPVLRAFRLPAPVNNHYLSRRKAYDYHLLLPYFTT